MPTPPSALEAATNLLNERRKYEQWLDELEAKKASTPTKVFDRVRQDYMARLQAVMEQLKEFTSTLQERGRLLMVKLRELEAQEQAHNEERAEAELRANVGEITEAEWESSSKKAQRELAKIKENQELVADELNQIRDVLGGQDDDDEDSPRRAAEFDELEFLKSVVGPAAAAAKPVPEPRPVTPPGSPATRSVTPGSTPATRPAAPASAPKPMTPSSVPATRPMTPSSPSAQVAKAPAAPKAEPPRIISQAPSENPLGVTSDEAMEQPRNLKCAECGTMNYASEWYCERCGAELAAI